MKFSRLINLLFYFACLSFTGLLVSPASNGAGYDDPVECSALADHPSLFQACVDKVQREIAKSTSKLTKIDAEQESCYCDVRKKRQFEVRQIRLQSISDEEVP